jgi:glycosyltransferase involved in cell wall biosynthesis
LENPSPELVRDHAWKLIPVSQVTIIPPVPLPVPQKPGGVSIIIPAWKAADFLQECLDSLAAQTHFAEGGKYEILLGIDACKSTRRRALKIAWNYENLRLFWFDQNYGPYLVKNTLAAKAKHDLILFFDVDDTAEPGMLTSLLELNQDRFNAAVYMMGEDSQGQVKQTCGVFLIGRKKFLSVGGFMPWPCAADTEFLKRLPAAKIIHRCSEQVLMRRRVHANQLTMKPDTGFGSKLRACYMRQIRQIAKLGIANIGLVTANCEALN